MYFALDKSPWEEEEVEEEEEEEEEEKTEQYQGGVRAIALEHLIIQKFYSVHISTLLGAQGMNPETPGQAGDTSYHNYLFNLHFSCVHL